MSVAELRRQLHEQKEHNRNILRQLREKETTCAKIAEITNWTGLGKLEEHVERLSKADYIKTESAELAELRRKLESPKIGFTGTVKTEDGITLNVENGLVVGLHEAYISSGVGLVTYDKEGDEVEVKVTGDFKPADGTIGRRYPEGADHPKFIELANKIIPEEDTPLEEEDDE